MKINNLEVKDFKGFGSNSFKFGDNVTIEGDNFKGKTSIAEAIVFSLYGVDLAGSSRTDNLINLEAKKATVTIELALNDEEVTIKREATRQKKVYLNGTVSSQAAVQELLPSLEIFMVQFLPTYILGMKDTPARELFMKFVEPVSPEIVLDSMNKDMAEPLRALNMESPEKVKKELSAESSELEKDVEYAEGEISVHEETLKQDIPELVDIEEEKESIDRLQEKRYNRPSVALKSTLELEEKLKEVEKNIYTKSPKEPELKDISILKEKVHEAEKKLLTGIPAPPELDSIAGLNSDLESLAREYKACQTTRKELSVKFKEGDSCPTCTQEISKETANSMLKKLHDRVKEISKTLEDIEKEGKNKKVEVAKTIKNNEKLEKDYQGEKETIVKRLEKETEKAVSAVEKAKENNNKLLATYKSEKESMLKDLEGKKEALKEEIRQVGEYNVQTESDFNTEENKKMQEIKDQIAELEKTVREAEDLNSQRKVLLTKKEEAEAKVAGCKERLEYNKVIINSNKIKLNYISNYISKFAELQSGQIQQHFTKASIQLFDIVKTTGEIKSAFKLLYDNKPASVLSMSERSRLGMEVSKAVKAITEIEGPTFLDNAESITSYEQVPGQMFTARVVKGKGLEVK